MRKIPWGLIGMIAFVVTGERFIANHRLDFTRPEGWEWRLNGENAKRKVKDAGVLAIGSSLVKLGIVPQAIEPVVGQPVYNLGMCAGPAPASYFLLRRALFSGAKPAVVLVEFHPNTLMRSHWHTEGFWPDLLDSRETVELSWTANDPRFFGVMMFSRWFPSVKDRHEVGSKLLGALQGKSTNYVGLLAMIRTMRKNQGAKIVPKSPEGPKAALPPEDIAFVADSWSCHPVNEVYVNRFFELTRSRGIPVVWLMPPVRPDLQRLREKNGLDRDYQAFARRTKDRYPHVTVVDATRSAYPADLFIDGMHLDREGAMALSADLAPILRNGAARLSTGENRWVSLAAFRNQAPTVTIEDFGQSVEAILRLSEMPKSARTR